MVRTFDESLKYGQVGEDVVSKYLQRKGCLVFDTCNGAMTKNKGPRLSGSNHDIVSPDLMIFVNGNTGWAEVKRKNGFTQYNTYNRDRKIKQWQTGIDLRLFKQYIKAAEETDLQLGLLFLHEGGWAKQSPTESPAGLFGQTIKNLAKRKDHEYEDRDHNHFNSGGMVFWNIYDLIKIDTYEEVVYGTSTIPPKELSVVLDDSIILDNGVKKIVNTQKKRHIPKNEECTVDFWL